MESKILAGLSFDPGLLIIAMLILMIAMIVYVWILHRKQAQFEKKYRALLRSGKAAVSHDVDIEIKSDKKSDRLPKVELPEIKDDTLNGKVARLEKNMNRSYQKMGIVKYDAFKEMGGKLSFACAILNDNNDGFVLNSIHSKEGCYNYMKEIIKGESFIPLGEEEAEALEQAIQYGLVK